MEGRDTPSLKANSFGWVNVDTLPYRRERNLVGKYAAPNHTCSPVADFGTQLALTLRKCPQKPVMTVMHKRNTSKTADFDIDDGMTMLISGGKTAMKKRLQIKGL
jgi:hypothetical protein